MKLSPSILWIFVDQMPLQVHGTGANPTCHQVGHMVEPIARLKSLHHRKFEGSCRCSRADHNDQAHEMEEAREQPLLLAGELDKAASDHQVLDVAHSTEAGP